MESSKLLITYTWLCKAHMLRQGEQERRCSSIAAGDDVWSWSALCVANCVSAAVSMWPFAVEATVMLIMITSLEEYYNWAQGILTSSLGEF